MCEVNRLKFGGLVLAFYVIATVLLIAGPMPITGRSNRVQEILDSGRVLRQDDTDADEVLPNVTSLHPNEDDLHVIELLLNEIFKDTFYPLNCPNSTDARHTARNCLVEMAHAHNGTRVYTCPNLQGQYDCANKSLIGCTGGREALALFFQQYDWIGTINGCRLDPRLNSTAPATAQDQRTNVTLAPNKLGAIFKSKRRSTKKNTIEGDSSEHDHSNDALDVLSHTTQLMLVSIPKIIILAYE